MKLQHDIRGQHTPAAYIDAAPTHSGFVLRWTAAALLALAILGGDPVGMPSVVAGEPTVLDQRWRHLRIDGPREWSDFPKHAEAAFWEISFDSSANAEEWTLQWRQQDVKQTWNVSLNGQRIGELERDENEMHVYLAVPPRAVREGENRLRIEQAGGGARPRTPDDIRIGQFVLHPRGRQQVLSDVQVQITVTSAETQRPLPARITVTRRDGGLQTAAASSDDQLAVRPGVIFTADGQASFGLPVGEYVIYAGRGFEYSVDSTVVSAAAGATVHRTLSLRHEAPLGGYVACDTHVHTLTHSGHGDATIRERMITLAAEGIELPIAADHNVHVDYEPVAREMQLRRYFTPIIGNEVTTPVGHFNVFPIQRGATPPDHRRQHWDEVFDAIYATPGVRAVILNHARDIHSGVRPFGPERFNDVVGVQLDDWPMRFNAMEVVNSSSTQNDDLRLFHDWMALLNRGLSITPVGSSDSHDVARHFVGQARTYIRLPDKHGDDCLQPGELDVAAAVDSFLQGRVLVSYGLAAELTVNERFRSGDLAMADSETIEVDVRIIAPHWVRAEEVRLYANGRQIGIAHMNESETPAELLSAETLSQSPAGLQWSGRWRIPRPAHDVHLTAIALGPGVRDLFWNMNKPYQPESPDWTPRAIGCSGAVRVDCDGDGRFSSAREYADRIYDETRGDLAAMTGRLADFDRAVAAQAFHRYQASGRSLLTDRVAGIVADAAAETAQGYRDYVAAWRRSQEARAQR